MIVYNINCGHPLRLRQNEHNMRSVRLEGYEKKRTDTALYFQPDDCCETLIPLTDNGEFTVQINITKEWGRFKGQIAEIKSETVNGTTTRTLIDESRLFTYEIAKSNIIYDENEVTDPSLELVWEQMHDLYVTIQTKLANGEFKGQKGDKGDKGDTGATGAKGDKGETGATGAKGDKGDTGEAGPSYDDTEIKQTLSTKASASDLANTNKAVSNNRRDIDVLWKLNEGYTYDFETDDTEAYTKDVPTGAKMVAVESVGGKSVVWNQLRNKNDFNRSDTCLGITFTNNGDGSLTVNGTASETITFIVNDSYTYNRTHKYYQFGCPKGGGINKYLLYTQQTATFDSGNGAIFMVQDDQSNILQTRIIIYSGTTVDNIVFKPRLVDLTTLFGSGNEPTTTSDSRIAWIEQYASEHPEYNAGEVIHADLSAVVERGKNIWDEEWENGIYYSNGTYENATNSIVSKNSINIVGGENYCKISNNGKTVFVLFYDSNDSFVSRTSNETFIAPTNTKYAKLSTTADYGNVYNNDIAIIKGTSGSYSPYHSTTHTIPTAIRNLTGYGWSAGSVYNEVDFENKKFIQRVGKCILDGTQSFLTGNPIDRRRYVELQNLNPKHYGYCLCDKFTGVTRPAEEDEDRALFVQNLGNAVGRINIYVTNFNGSELTSYFATNQTDIYYELATPIETDITDILEPFEVESGGSITFENANKLSVPNKLNYTIKLSEVES